MNTKSSKNLIYGKNPVYETITKNPQRINKIYIQKGFSFDKRLKKIHDLAYQNKIIVQLISLQKFKEFFEEDVNFQGVIADVSPIDYIELEDYLEENYLKQGHNQNKDTNQTYKKIIILDGIQDPHNFGAIIRTAVGVGVDAIMVSNHRSCPINATVEKISSGAINHIPIIKTSSLSSSIEVLKKNNYWVIATQMEARNNYYEIDYTDMNFALVLGSEGKGISKTILNQADFTIKLKSNFESLNVSIATAVILYEAQRQIELKNLESSSD